MTPNEILAKKEDKNEYHLHRVDRQWIIEAMIDYAEHCLNDKLLQTEISDKDIKKKIKKEWNYTNYQDRHWIEVGAKWYKEQLKSK